MDVYQSRAWIISKELLWYGEAEHGKSKVKAG